MSPPESVSFDRIADRYDETRGGDRRGVELSADIAPLLLPGRTLEVGVGTGVVASGLRQRGVDILGVDISAAMLSRAYARLGPRVVLGDAHAQPFATASVHNVVLVWVLHLVGDPAAVLAEAARVLVPGGRVVVLHGRARGQAAIDEVLAPLRDLLPARPDDWPDLLAASERAGLTVAHRGRTTEYPMAQAPAEVADLLEQRVWSWLWSIDDTGWQERVVPAIAALRAMPEPDRPLDYRTSQQIAVFTPDGQPSMRQ